MEEDTNIDPIIAGSSPFPDGNPTDGVKSLYGETSHDDITIPDIPIPEIEEPRIEKNKDECDVAFKFGFIGAGQGGSRIAETFQTLGYNRLAAINTAEQDLNTIKLENKLLVGEG